MGNDKSKKFKMNNDSLYKEHKNLIEIINKNNLQEEIQKGNCVLIFYMKSCPYCIKLKQVILELCNNNKKVVVMERQNIDSDLKKQYNITGYPTIYIIKPDGSKEEYTDKRNYESMSLKLI